jgi:hypothetical protein
MKNNQRKPHTEDKKQASNLIAVSSVVGLTLCFIAALYKDSQTPLILYAIFGGGILGTDNVIKLVKSIFRIGDK